MKLEKLILENFRQFRDRQELVFSTYDDRNITLVHAENGFGKTALLNALLWGFYGSEGLTKRFEQKEKLVNNTTAALAKDPQLTEAAVTILFEHDGVRYTLRRSLSLAQQLVDARKTELRLEFIRDGQPYQDRQPQSRISSFMPIGISPFLFFDEGGIDELAMEENASRITDAIHQMLGLKLLRTSVEDFRHQSVRGKLRAELRDKTSDAKKALLDRQTEIDEAIEQHQERMLTAQDNLANICTDLAKVEDKLLANRTAHEMQKRRNELKERSTKLTEQKQTVSRRLAQLIAEDGFTLFSADLVQRGRELVAQLRSQGKIPARVLNTFIEELLDGATCICTRPLAAGSPERTAVEQLLTRAGDAHFNNAVGALDNAIGVLEGAYQRTRDSIRETNAERLRVGDDLIDITEELEKIRQKLGGKEDEEVHDLEGERDRLLLRERECQAEINRLEGRLAQLKEEREELTGRIRELDDNEAAAKLAQQRLDIVEGSADLIERILEIETDELRPLLNEEIKKHFLRIIDRPYWPELSADFILKVRENITTVDAGKLDEIDVALSTGQRQITSLVFIASLLALAKRRADIPTILRGLSGSEYPIVMDSPFGTISTHFRKGVTRWVPSLAPEVLMMVSDEQFRGPVAETLRDTKKVGRRYYIRVHGPGEKPHEEDMLTVDGRSYQRYFETPEKFTDIVEIEE